MHRYPVSVLLFTAITCLGIVTGFWQKPNDSGNSVEIKSDSTINEPASRNATTSSSGQSTTANRIKTFSTAIDTGAADETDTPNSVARLYQTAQKSDVARKALMDHYLNAADGDVKAILGAMLSKLQTQDVQNFAIKLAESNDALQRKDGFALLEAQEIKSPKARELALQALAMEKDPDTLRRAIATLQPMAMESSENTAVLQQLQGLIQHEDPSVRAQAVNTLANLDKTGESANALQQALTDTESQVRWAAVDAIADNRIRSEELKTALIDIAANTDEATDLRLSAANTLEHFSLDQGDYSRILQATRDVDQQQVHGNAGAM